ncbi:MAG: LysE family translocator [Flavobacteriaceae bacterium]|nr:LysE family translocator [Flavobacteriaceae bacterium]
MIEQIAPFLLASILLTLSPGPDILYVLIKSLQSGRSAGIVLSLGLVTGIIIHTVLVASGVSAVILASEILFLGVKVFGALYLVYLSWRVFKQPARINLDRNAPQERTTALFRRGFIMNVLNPKVSIFFLAFFPGFLWDDSANTFGQIIVLGVIFMVQAFIIFSLVSVFAGSLAKFLKKDYVALFLKHLQILLFLGIAVYLFL